ncbi:MAG: hypothetical protein M3O93_08365 [Chloroflexota bacterium]|nr:hypothetical protein [Chloroflexota bacterium]
MHTILAIFAALVGSTFGNAVRAGVDTASQRLKAGGGTTSDDPIMVNGSLLASVVTGTTVSTVGGGAGLAFWIGAVLGAAGADRLDWVVFKRFGLDRDKLIAQAREAGRGAAVQGRRRASPRAKAEA